MIEIFCVIKIKLVKFIYEVNGLSLLIIKDINAFKFKSQIK